MVDYIKRFIKFPDNEISEFRKKIQENHLSLLKPGSSCLIADKEELVYNNKNQLTARRKTIFSKLPPGIKHQSWKWIFDTGGAYNKNQRTEFSIVAIEI